MTEFELLEELAKELYLPSRTLIARNRAGRSHRRDGCGLHRRKHLAGNAHAQSERTSRPAEVAHGKDAEQSSGSCVQEGLNKGHGYYVTAQKSRTDFPKSVSQVKDN